MESYATRIFPAAPTRAEEISVKLYVKCTLQRVGYSTRNLVTLSIDALLVDVCGDLQQIAGVENVIRLTGASSNVEDTK
jgi:hypothetical protein